MSSKSVVPSGTQHDPYFDTLDALDFEPTIDLTDPEDVLNGLVTPNTPLAPDGLHANDAPGILEDVVIDLEGIGTNDEKWFIGRGIPVFWAEVEYDARSIGTAEDGWPETLKYFAKSSGGAFRLDYVSLTGGHGWSQCRPKKAPKDKNGRARKYLGNSGDATGERLIVNKTMAERINKSEYTRVLIVEGTGQSLLASYLYRDDETTVVVGVPGCYGWSDEGICAPEVHRVCAKAEEVFICFDADVLTNPKVWDAGSRLSAVVEAATGSRPRFLHLPVGKTQGFDDWVSKVFMSLDLNAAPGTLDEDGARKAVGNLLKSKTACKPLTATRPKESKEVVIAASAEVETTDGDVDVSLIPNGVALIQEGRIIAWHLEQPVVAHFEMRIVRSYRTVTAIDNAHTTTIVHDIEVIDGGVGHFVEGWPNSRLKEVEAILEAAGCAHAVWNDSPANRSVIVTALKADAKHRGVSVDAAMTHTGIFEATAVEGQVRGPLRWADGTGMFTVDGYTRDHGRAHLDDPNGAKMDYSIYEGKTPEQIREAVRDTVMGLEFFADPTWYVLSLGSLFSVVQGMTPEGGTWMVGNPNVGKTQRQTFLASMLGPQYGLETLVGAEFKTAADVAKGLHCGLTIPEDFTRNADDKTLEAVEILVRRTGGSEGEKNGRRVKTQLANGKWGQQQADASHVVMAFSGEVFPAGLIDSSKQRLISCHVGSHGWTVDGLDYFDDFVSLGRSGKPRLATAAFIHRTLQFATRSFEGDLRAFVEWQTERRNKWASKMKDASILKTSELRRPSIVAAGRFVGWLDLMLFATEIDAITGDEQDRLWDLGYNAIHAAMEAHVEKHVLGLRGMTGHDVVAALAEQDFGGIARLWTSNEDKGFSNGNARRFGKVHTDTATGEKYACISAPLAAQVLGKDPREIQAALREVATPFMKGDREVFTKSVRLEVNGQSKAVDAYWVPWATWEGEAPASATEDSDD